MTNLFWYIIPEGEFIDNFYTKVYKVAPNVTARFLEDLC